MSYEEVVWLRSISKQLDALILAIKKLEVPVYQSGPPVHMSVIVGPVTKQGASDMPQIHDNEQFTLTVSAVDSKGFPTPDVFTAVSSDVTVATVLDDDQDGKTFLVVAGNPGSATITISESDGPLFVTEAVDVVVGDAVTIKVEEGPVEVQPAPEPPVEV